MACSHASTFGPRMNCCDSITSAIAASTSDLMAAYCDLRSSNGTFMPHFLSQRPVRLRPARQFSRQRRLVVEIETAQHARLRFPVVIAAFGADHHAVRVGCLQAVTVTTHPSDLACRIA